MKHSGEHLAGYVVLVLLVILVALVIVAIASPKRRRPILKAVAWTLGGLAGVYLVIRGIAEFFIVNYNDPASYRDAWGGPSLAGVFAVHAGPGFVVLVCAIAYLIRRLRNRQPASEHAIKEPTPVASEDKGSLR